MAGLAELVGLPPSSDDRLADDIVKLMLGVGAASTAASTYHGPEVSIERIRRAVEALDRLPPAPSEIRLHPDDLRELRLQAGERVAAFGGLVVVAGNFAGSLLGLPVVEDIDAPRLPRKPSE